MFEKKGYRSERTLAKRHFSVNQKTDKELPFGSVIRTPATFLASKPTIVCALS